VALVTGLTKERMLVIEAASVVSGEINGSGHLILTTHGGTEIDAGYALVAIPDASTTVKGVSELATQAETEAHTDATRAVTPASLASTFATIADHETRLDGFEEKKLNPASYSQSTAGGSYPLGISYLYMIDTETTAGGWDFAGKYGLVTTYRYSSDMFWQTWVRHEGGTTNPTQMWIRTGNSPSGWSNWYKLASSSDPSTMGITGEIKMWSTTTAPSGWQICDGTALSRTTDAALFAVIGTTYGVGDGSTTFNVPNMKGRVLVGYDSSQTEFDSMGETGGAKTHTLTSGEMPSHTHTQNAHAHTMNGTGGTGALTDGTGTTNYNVSGTTTTYGFKTNQPGNTTAVNQNTGGGGAHNNLQPYLVGTYIIKK
jgi:microcystin-dependent protein